MHPAGAIDLGDGTGQLRAQGFPASPIAGWIDERMPRSRIMREFAVQLRATPTLLQQVFDPLIDGAGRLAVGNRANMQHVEKVLAKVGDLFGIELGVEIQ